MDFYNEMYLLYRCRIQAVCSALLLMLRSLCFVLDVHDAALSVCGVKLPMFACSLHSHGLSCCDDCHSWVSILVQLVFHP
jgi:hypothetical protein